MIHEAQHPLATQTVRIEVVYGKVRGIGVIVHDSELEPTAALAAKEG